MKFLSRVVWSEGMHLGPHHFQTQSRYFEDTLWFLNSNLRQEPWGFLHFSLDTEALRNGLAILSFASGILPDGLIFDLPDCDAAPEPAQLSELFASTDSEIILHLAIPPRQDQGLDCDLAGGASARYGAVRAHAAGRCHWPGGIQRLLRPEESGSAEPGPDLRGHRLLSHRPHLPRRQGRICQRPRLHSPLPAHRRLRRTGTAAPPAGPGHRREDRLHPQPEERLRRASNWEPRLSTWPTTGSFTRSAPRCRLCASICRIAEATPRRSTGTLPGWLAR